MPYQIKNGIVYGSNAVSLTQAQYDALSTAEKNNGTVYYIYDSEAVLDASDVSLGSGTVEDLAGSVAVIETSPATATHAVGDYIVWNGKLYEVTTAIAVGETLTVGTNISATTVGEELSTLTHDAVSSAPLAANGTYQIPTEVLNHKLVIIIFRRYGHIGSTVFLSDNIKSGVATEGSTIYPYTGVNYTFTISGTGLLKITTITGNLEPYIQVVGIL